MKATVESAWIPTSANVSLVDNPYIELTAWWNLWLHQAQATNDPDENLYSHGVFERDPAVVGRS